MKLKALLQGATVVVVFGLLALLVWKVTHEDKGVKTGGGRTPAAPGFELARLDSPGKLALASLRGKVVVLNVFASWCSPCVAEAPILEQEQRKLAGRDATVLGVTYLDNSDASQAFVHQQHITYPVIRDVSGNFVRSFGTTGVPETFVIDRQGRIAALRRFQIDSKWLSQTLPPILAQQS